MIDSVEVPPAQEVSAERYLPSLLLETLASPDLEAGGHSTVTRDSPATPASSMDCSESREDLDLGPGDGGLEGLIDPHPPVA